MKQVSVKMEAIYQLLKEKRLKEALIQLQSVCSQDIPWGVRNQIESSLNDYNYMLQYARQGINDPNRKDFFLRELRTCYELADKVQVLLPEGKSSTLLQEEVRKQSQSPLPSYTELREQLESITEDLGTVPVLFSHPDEQKKQISLIQQRHEEAIKNLFMRTWADLGWSDADEQEANVLLSSVIISYADLAVFISALTLHAFHFFDPRQVNILISAVRHTELVVSQRALVGIALISLIWEERISLYPALKKQLEELFSKGDICQRLFTIQLQLLQTRETAKIDKKMREDIIPNLIKETKDQMARHQQEELNDLNPEWDMNEPSPNLQKVIKEIEGWKQEGADLYMNSFGPLKQHDFFRQLPHWFYPFDKEQPDIAKYAEKLSKIPENPLAMFLIAAHCCHTDKYSICLNLGLFAEQIGLTPKLQMPTTEEQEQEWRQRVKDAPLTPKLASRVYIQDLHRFFKFWYRRKELDDIFTFSFHFWENRWMKAAFHDNEISWSIANYLFVKGYYDEALPIYQILVQSQPDKMELWQKMGYIFQKQKEYEKAIDCLQHSELITTEDQWTQKHLAQCFRLNQQFSKAIIYYEQLIQRDENHIQWLIQAGRCYLQMNELNKALQYLHKAQYLCPDQPDIIRDLIWAHLLKGEWEEGLNYHHKLKELGSLVPSDWINAGHLCLLNKHMNDALGYYQQALNECKSADDFVAAMRKDKEQLITLGLKEEDFYVLIDILL